MSAKHYENFPVASWLCPPALRPAVSAIYRYARTADDLADEGDASAGERLADLAAYRQDLLAVAGGRAASPRWASVFDALRPVLLRHALPVELLCDLLDAFEQDLVKLRYADRPELLDYCRRSANPVGRLLLHLYGVNDARSLQQSDAICTALQLINFWQDLGVDLPRGRLYVPESDCREQGVAPALLLALAPMAGLPRLVERLVAWARELMLEGAPLAGRIGGRAGWELRLVVQGGLRILEKIEAGGFDSVARRPRLHGFDLPLLGWRALRMSPRASAPQPRSA